MSAVSCDRRRQLALLAGRDSAPRPVSPAGLILVISDKPDVERDAVAAAWERAGGEVVRLGRFWDPPALDATRVRLYGADAFCQVLAQKLDVALVSPPDDWLLHLPFDLVKRALARTPTTYPAFVKSMIPKLIPSRVYASADGIDPDVELIVSEVIELAAEARTWVLDGEVVTIACYEGDAPLAAARALATAAAAHAPSPCVIDVGLTPDRGWVVIEANAAWGAGLNGCDPEGAARCIARATHP